MALDMKRRIHPFRLLQHLAIGTLLSILVFFSASFLTFIADQPTFNPYAEANYWRYHMEMGFPFTYFQQDFIGSDGTPFTRADILNLLLDCVITWTLIALPYALLTIRKDKKQLADSHFSELIDDQR